MLFESDKLQIIKFSLNNNVFELLFNRNCREKMLIKVCCREIKSFLRIEDTNLEVLLKAVKDKYGNGVVIFKTTDDVEIAHNDVIEFIKQYKTDTNFILHIDILEGN